MDLAIRLKELVLKNRSRRRFFQEHFVDRETLVELVDLARLSASGMNRQPLKYMLSNEATPNARIFPLLGWAGYLKEWGGPVEGERPSAYIVMLGDKNISVAFGIDPGIAAQSIMLGATEKGLGVLHHRHGQTGRTAPADGDWRGLRYPVHTGAG